MELAKAGANDAASGLQIAVDQESHRDRSGVPAACGETSKYRVNGGSFVEVKRLRIEFRGKALDAVRIDADAPGSEGLSRVKVLQVRLGHKRLSVFAPGSRGPLYMMAVIIV
jgi:hypothetical protein